MLEVEQLQQHIRNYTPFECSNWNVLGEAFLNEYDPIWGTSIVWTVGCIRSLQKFEKFRGSWNAHVKRVDNYQELYSYKVFRQRINTFKYEFHDAEVPINTWIKAEVSGSTGLSGIKKKEDGGDGGYFHMLYNESQAIAYLNTRALENDAFFPKTEAVIKKVIGRFFCSIDLVYIPPKQFVWGIDAYEMYVPR